MFPLTLAILTRTDTSRLDNIHSGAGQDAGPVIFSIQEKNNAARNKEFS